MTQNFLISSKSKQGPSMFQKQNSIGKGTCWVVVGPVVEPVIKKRFFSYNQDSSGKDCLDSPFTNTPCSVNTRNSKLQHFLENPTIMWCVTKPDSFAICSSSDHRKIFRKNEYYNTLPVNTTGLLSVPGWKWKVSPITLSTFAIFEL